jgi:hypothetical protein
MIEFENLLDELKKRIIAEYIDVFGDDSNPGHGLTAWFTGLSEEKKTHVYVGETACLVDTCRESGDINDDTLLNIAEKLTGLQISSWADALVVKFGAKLESAKTFVDSFEPPPVNPDKDDDTDLVKDLPPGQGSMSIFLNGQNKVRTFEIMDSLSPNGDVMENMLNSTIEQLGKGLDEQEKVAIIYRVVGKHVFGA